MAIADLDMRPHHSASDFSEALSVPRVLREALADGRLRIGSLVICAAVVLASHAALGLALIAWGLRDTGAIKQPTDAVSVEMIVSDVVEQAMQPELSASAASAAAVAPVEGDAPENARAVAPAENEIEPEKPLEQVAAAEPPPQKQNADVPQLPVATEESEIPEVAAREPAPPDEPVAAPPQKKQKVEKPLEKANEPKHRPQTKAAKSTEDTKTPDNRKQGGARARGQAESKGASARVSASAGDISGYAARVRARVASNRPSGGGLRGTAVISFGVSKGGGLTYARVARSSGNSRLDQLALSAVRRASPFPPPPAGASTGQLRFSSPFHFR